MLSRVASSSVILSTHSKEREISGRTSRTCRDNPELNEPHFFEWIFIVSTLHFDFVHLLCSKNFFNLYQILLIIFHIFFNLLSPACLNSCMTNAIHQKQARRDTDHYLRTFSDLQSAVAVTLTQKQIVDRQHIDDISSSQNLGISSTD